MYALTQLEIKPFVFTGVSIHILNLTRFDLCSELNCDNPSRLYPSRDLTSSSRQL